MAATGMVITFTTSADTADAFAAVLERALPLVEREPGTLVWMAGRSMDDPTVFHLVDVFGDAGALNAHMGGEAAALILGEGASLLVAPPAISAISILATKGG